MYRTLALVALALAALAGLAACGDEGDGGATTPAASPASSSPATTPASTPTQEGGDPAAQYADLCAGCHQDDGSGGFGPDLRGEDDVAGIAAQISDGGGRMPGFSDQLTDAQISALATWVAGEL